MVYEHIIFDLYTVYGLHCGICRVCILVSSFCFYVLAVLNFARCLIGHCTAIRSPAQVLVVFPHIGCYL